MPAGREADFVGRAGCAEDHGRADVEERESRGLSSGILGGGGW